MLLLFFVVVEGDGGLSLLFRFSVLVLDTMPDADDAVMIFFVDVVGGGAGVVGVGGGRGSGRVGILDFVG